MSVLLHSPSSWVLSQNASLRYIVFFLLYVMQGVPAGFALTAVANYLAAEGLAAHAVGNFVALVGLPWGLKFVWGPVVDRYTYAPMGRRRPWVLGAQLMALLSLMGIVGISDPVTQFWWLGVAFSWHALFASLQDVVVDALAIEVTPPDERGRANAFMRAGFVAGSALGAAGLGYVLRYGSFRTAALCEAGLLLLLTVLMFFVRERPGDQLLPGGTNQATSSSSFPAFSFTELFRRLWRGIVTRNSLLMIGAVSLVYMTESLFRRALDVYLIQELNWTDVALSGLRGTAGTTITLGAVFVGGWLVDRIGGRRVLVGTVLAISVVVLGYTVGASYWSSVTLTTGYILTKFTLDTLVNVAAIPLFMYLCRPGVEGSQFVFYMALSNQMDVLGASLVGTVTAYLPVTEVGYVGAGAALLALVLLSFVRTGSEAK